MAEGEHTEAARPDLESIAKNVANIEDDHQIHQIMPSVWKAIYTHPDFVTKDEKTGIDVFKVNFSEKEAEKLADVIYDQFVDHIGHRAYGLDKVTHGMLKGKKDKHGNSFYDNHISTQFGVSRKALQEALTKNRHKLSEQNIGNILEQSINHHSSYHLSKITENIRDEHVGHLKDFISHNVEAHGLNKDQYKVDGVYKKEDLLQHYFTPIATAHYKHHKKEDKK